MGDGNATHSQLSALHGKLTESLSSALDDDEFVSPALFTITAKFLKDNDITCQPEEGTKVNALDEKLKAARAKRLTKVTLIHPDKAAATC
jgi:hypothetical protein